MICPKCGFDQDEAEECISGGIIIKKFKGTTPPEPAYNDQHRFVTVKTAINPKKDRKVTEITIIIAVILSFLTFGGVILYMNVKQEPAEISAEQEEILEQRRRKPPPSQRMRQEGDTPTEYKIQVDRVKQRSKQVGEDYVKEVDNMSDEIF